MLCDFWHFSGGFAGFFDLGSLRLFVPLFVPVLPLCVVIAGLFIEDGVLVTKD